MSKDVEKLKSCALLVGVQIVIKNSSCKFVT